MNFWTEICLCYHHLLARKLKLWDSKTLTQGWNSWVGLTAGIQAPESWFLRKHGLFFLPGIQLKAGGIQSPRPHDHFGVDIDLGPYLLTSQPVLFSKTMRLCILKECGDFLQWVLLYVNFCWLLQKPWEKSVSQAWVFNPFFADY